MTMKCSFAAVLVATQALMLTGCFGKAVEKRDFSISVNTEPPNARIWVGDKTGEKILGSSPYEFQRPYDVEVFTFDRNLWWGFGSATAAFAGSLAVLITGLDDETQQLVGIGTSAATGVTAGLLLIACIVGEVLMGEKPYIENLKLGASLDGYKQRSIDVQIPGDRTEVNLLLEKEQAVAVPGAALPAAPSEPRPAERIPVIAVFEIQDASRKLDKDTILQLTNYLGTVLTQGGRYRSVPQEQIRSRLRDDKAGTYRQCYDDSCQIELGKAVAAELSLSTTLIQVGNRCAVTANLFDLKSETAVKGASAETGCTSDELLGAMRKIAEQL